MDVVSFSVKTGIINTPLSFASAWNRLLRKTNIFAKRLWL